MTRVTPVPSSAKRLDNPATVANISQLTPAQAGYPPNTFAQGQQATQAPQLQGPPIPATPELAIAPGAKVDTTSPLPTPAPFPAHCSWFVMSEIHDTEKTSLPEFFNGKFPSKTPAVYVPVLPLSLICAHSLYCMQIQGIPGFHDQHVYSKSTAVPHSNGVQAQPHRRRMRSLACAPVPRALGTHQLPRLPRHWRIYSYPTICCSSIHRPWSRS